MLCAENYYPNENFSAQEIEWLQKMQTIIQAFDHRSVYSDNFNLLRWLYAYEGDVELAASKYRRHLRIRSILQLDFIEELSELDGMDVAADSFAPMTFLGEVGNGDHRVLLLEQSGKFDLVKIVQTIRTSAFMVVFTIDELI